MKKQPLLSIVTICLNDLKALKRTFDSIFNQEFRDFEFIIIDGGSTDGTIDFINQKKESIDYYLSEPDKGIYDAFNKGINSSNGKYVHLLNSGDVYLNTSALLNIDFDHNSDYICSSVLKKSKKDWVWLPRLNKISNFIDLAHPGLIVKREVYKKVQYSTKYSYVSDALFIYNNVKPEESLIRDEILVEMSDGGFSTGFSLKHEIEKHRLLIENKVRSKEKLILHFKYLVFFFKKALFYIIKK